MKQFRETCKKVLSLTLLLAAAGFFCVSAPGTLSAFAQTVVTPTVSNGVARYTVTNPDGSTVSFAVNLTGSVTYNPPPPVVPPPSGAVIPADATQVILDPITWKQTKDAGTPGTACTTALPCSNPYPVVIDSAHATARQFNMKYTGQAGVRWSATIANDTKSTNFVYDVQAHATDWAQVANLELDINQVTAAGKTRILGSQCSHYDHGWDNTFSKLATGGSWHWVPSKAACDPTTWAPNSWHHIQLVGHFDSNDVSYYDGVWLDGKYVAFNTSGQTGYALGWSKGSVVVNFQIDGLNKTNGSTAVSAYKLTIYRW